MPDLDGAASYLNGWDKRGTWNMANHKLMIGNVEIMCVTDHP